MSQPLIMTVRIIGGEPQRVTEALRRAGLTLELGDLGSDWGMYEHVTNIGFAA